MSKYVETICKKAKTSSYNSSKYDTRRKNNTLSTLIKEIRSSKLEIIKYNDKDIKLASKMGVKDSFLDRLVLNKSRIDNMIDGLDKIIQIPDITFSISKSKRQLSGIYTSQMRVPIGVIFMIYESRPNVTIDAAGLCLKSGNSVILRGGSESLNTNAILINLLENSLIKNKIDKNFIQLVKKPDRKYVSEFLRMSDYIDVIIPRGGKGLIKNIIQNSSIPIIKHLDGNCHVYIDKSANIGYAKEISINSKTQRYGVCNAMETLLIHKSFSKKHTKEIIEDFLLKGVTLKGCSQSRKLNQNIQPANDKDYFQEFLAPKLAIKIVPSLDVAISHINKYGSMHTDAIISDDDKAIDKFKLEVNSSSVMVNTSTRFADGYEYGLGAEIGISTDKIHARGPVGLEGLTNLKYIVNSKGKIKH